MSYSVAEETIERIRRDLGRHVERSRIAEVARQVTGDLGDARVPDHLSCSCAGSPASG